MKQLESIHIAVKWYQDLPKGYNDLHTLSEARRRLSVILFQLADYLGGLHGEYNIAYYERKRQLAATKREYEKKGENSTKAQSLAEVDTEQYLLKEKQSESLFRSIKYIYEAGKDVLDSMTQDISMLKQEKNYTQSHG